MKLLITLEVDGTESECEAMLDELDTARQDNELISLISSGGTFEVTLLKIEELPAVGRHRVDYEVHPDQLHLPLTTECDCVAHEWRGRECTCTCTHSEESP